MKTLSRDSIQRMAGGVSSNTSISGGGGGGGSAGISTGWVEANFLSKEFFNLLFEVHINTKVTVTDGLETTETNTAGVLSPNDTIPEDVVEQDTPSEGYTTTTHVSITSIEAKSNFWSSLAISALGLNSGGGGGGGSSTLQGLLDVNIPATLTQDNDGQVLMYNYAQNKWINATIQQSGGTVTSITAGTGLSGGTITSSGTIAISSTYQSYIGHGETAYGWGNHAQAGYLTSVAFSDLTSHPTTLAGYSITDAKIAGGVITLGTNTITPWTSSNHPTTLSGYNITDALSNATTFWGQTASNGVVSGNMTSVGSITMKGLIYGAQALELNNDSTSHGTSHGGYIDFHYNGSTADYTSRIIENSESILSVQSKDSSGTSKLAAFIIGNNFNGSYLQIGNIKLIYESGNNALRVQKSDGSAANFYADGAVSALGFSSSGGTTSIDSLTINSSILVNDYAGSSLKALSVTKATSGDTTNYLNIGETWKNSLHDTRIYGWNVQLVSGNGAYALSMNGAGKVTCPNYLQASRIYLDSTRYLYLSGSNLYFYNGSSSVQIA